jgi:murein DD-endopeptidase MepM/ murein hydrolase activator NlpD
MQFADSFSLPFGPATFGNRFGVHDIVNGHDLYGPQGHRGTDFVIASNTPVPAIANAVVEDVVRTTGLGNVVILRHYLHGAGNDVYSFSCHLNAALVHKGQPISKSAIIGRSGMTGTQATGPHLHLAMSHDDEGGISGEVFDPIAFITSHQPTKPASFSPKYTAARRHEGLIAIASRSKITFDAIRKLNPKITAPEYLVRLGQQVRIK